MTFAWLIVLGVSAWANECPRALVPLEPMRFHFVSPGKFKTRLVDEETGELGERIEREVKEPFEMASTLITQGQWNAILTGTDSGLPNYPVKGITIRKVRQWIARLNELSQNDDPRVYRIIENHRPMSTYRLPSEDEWMRVTTEGYINFRLGHRGSTLLRVAWLLDNSKGIVKRVATREPLWADGKPFYDLIGLVEEYMQEFWRDDLRQPPETVSLFERNWAVARGGSVQFEHRFFDFLYVRRLFREDFIGRRTRFERHVGARLVRDLPRNGPFIKVRLSFL